MSRRRTGPGPPLAAMMLAGCAALLVPGVAAAESTDAVYEVTASDLAVRVYRDGPLAGAGHNHVVASTALTGHVVIREPLTSSSVELELPLASLTVDEPARRAAAGADFPGQLTAAKRERTLRNMLGPALLAADRYPVLSVRSLSIASRGTALTVTMLVDIAGAARTLVVPVEWRTDADSLEAEGRFTVSHAELGLVPFSIAFGALRVRDDIEIEFRVTARRVVTGPPA